MDNQIPKKISVTKLWATVILVAGVPPLIFSYFDWLSPLLTGKPISEVGSILIVILILLVLVLLTFCVILVNKNKKLHTYIDENCNGRIATFFD